MPYHIDYIRQKFGNIVVDGHDVHLAGFYL